MSLQEEMFNEVEAWYSSGDKKSDFLAGKPYSQAKFNYWLAKWKSLQTDSGENGFKELGFSEVKFGKVLEIEVPSGVKITIFA